VPPRPQHGTVPLLALCAALLAGALQASDETGLRVRRSDLTGRVAFVTTADGGAIALPAGTGATGFKGFLATHGRLFGIRDPEAELRLRKMETGPLGHTHATYDQVYGGVRVFPGEIKLHRNARGGILAANGDFLPVPPGLDLAPRVDPGRAARIAGAHLLALHPAVQRQELVIADPGWYGDPPRGAQLTWYVEVADPEAWVSEAFLIGAHTGELLDRWSLVLGDKQREIHDGLGLPDLPGPMARAEGDPPALPPGDPAADDVNRAYDYFGDVYEYYARAFGRDGLDDAGLTMRATVNSTSVENWGVPCPSAYWSIRLLQTAFCLGRVPDDVVAHELTHGVTSFTSGLIPQNQSGQLNESYSYVFGETVDLINSGSEAPGPGNGPPPWSGHPSGTGLDTPNNRRTACSNSPDHPDGVRWLYNEDRFPLEGAINDLWDPTCKNHPDRANSPLQACQIGDSGGVHTGAGVPNHAYAILVDGKTFNGHTVNGIGLTRAAAVWYRAMTTYLFAGADFQDAYWALNQSAADLVGTFPVDPRTGAPGAEFTAAEAAEVDEALRAVEMDTPGRCGKSTDLLISGPPVECSVQVPIWEEDFEAGMTGWIVGNSGPPTPYDWEVTLPGELLPFERAGQTAHCPDLNALCTGPDESAVHWIASPPIDLPPSVDFPTLAFTHFMDTHAAMHGGNLDIRVNGGPWQPLPFSAFYHNGYNRRLLDTSVGGTNPMGGEVAFSGSGGDWGTSLAYLGGLAGGGDSIQIRFNYGRDRCWGAGGWWVDEVRVYDCAAGRDCDGNGVPDEVQVATGGGPHVILRHEPTHGDGLVSDADITGTPTVRAQRFELLAPETVQTIRIWGGYYPNDRPSVDDFTVIFHAHHPSFAPGTPVDVQTGVPTSREPTGFRIAGVAERLFTLELPRPVSLGAGTLWVEIFNDTTGNSDTFFWVVGEIGPGLPRIAQSWGAPGSSWSLDGHHYMAIEMTGGPTGPDCNGNGSPDPCDVADGTSPDCNGNELPDECETFQPPTETPDLTVERDRLAWTATGGTIAYDVVRGDIALLHAGGGDFAAATQECLASTTTDITLPYPPRPGPGDWFLVRGNNCGAAGTWDTGAPSQVGERDAEIDAAVGACP